MIPRSLCGPSRAVLRRRLPARQPHQPFLSPLQRVTPFAQRISSGRYSTTTETSSHSSAEASPAADGPKEELSAEDKLELDLDSKQKEIIDLKVRLPPRCSFKPSKRLRIDRLFFSFEKLSLTTQQDKYLRSVAEFRNLQERTKRDIETARSFAITRFASDLIESVDNLARALDTVPADKLASKENADLVNLYDGLKMTESILMQTLKKHGLERFDPLESGEKFNPNMHEATFQTKVEGKEDGDIFMTQQKGFSLNGRVVRAAKVGVVKNS